MATQTPPLIGHDLRLAIQEGLVPRTNSGWLTGFGNMLTKELGEWFGTHRWLWQSLIWLVLINGFVAFTLFLLPTLDPTGVQPGNNPPLNIMAWTFYFSFAIIAGSIGMIILMQDEIIQEKQSGTAAWILSKPVARPVFPISKWTANVIGGLIFIVALPAIVTVGEIFLAAQPGLPILPLLAGIGVVVLTLIFYASLVILLGVSFEQRGPVLGIAFGVMFGGMLAAQLVPQISTILPLNMDQVAIAVAQGQALPSTVITQLIMTAVWSVFFMAVALRRFQRIEF